MLDDTKNSLPHIASKHKVPLRLKSEAQLLLRPQLIRKFPRSVE